MAIDLNKLSLKNLRNFLDRDKEKEGFQLFSAPRQNIQSLQKTRQNLNQTRSANPRLNPERLKLSNAFANIVPATQAALSPIRTLRGQEPSQLVKDISFGVRGPASLAMTLSSGKNKQIFDSTAPKTDRELKAQQTGRTIYGLAATAPFGGPSKLLNVARRAAVPTIGGAALAPALQTGARLSGFSGFKEDTIIPQFGAEKRLPTGQELKESSKEGAFSGFKASPLLAVTNPLTSKVVNSVGGTLFQKQVGQRAIGAVANLFEDEILAKIDDIELTKTDRLFSLALGGAMTGNNNLFKTEAGNMGISDAKISNFISKQSKLIKKAVDDSKIYNLSWIENRKLNTLSLSKADAANHTFRLNKKGIDYKLNKTNDSGGFARLGGEQKAPKTPEPVKIKAEIPKEFSIKKQPGIVKKTLQSLFTKNKNVLRKAGDNGKIAANLMDQAEKQGARNAGDAQFILKRAFDKLSDDEIKNFSDYIELKADIPNKNVGEAVVAWNAVSKDVLTQSKKVGLDVGEIENYFPHFVPEWARTKKGRLEYLNQLVNSGFAEDIGAADIKLRQMQRTAPRRYGNLEKSRTINLPVYDKSGNVLLDYVSDSYKRIAEAENFGPNDAKLYELALKDANGDFKAESYYQSIVDQVLGKDDQTTLSRDISSGIRSAQTIRKLSPTTSLKNLTQNLSTAIRTDIPTTIRAMSDFVRNPEKAMEVAIRSGEIDEKTLKRALQDFGGDGSAAGKWIKLIGMQGTERFNRIIATNAGYNYTKKLASQGSEAANRELKRLGITDAQIKKGLTESDLIDAGRQVSKDTQFITTPGELPLFWNSPTGRVLTQFKSFAFKQTEFGASQVKRVAKEAVKGNIKPLANMLTVVGVAAPVVGEIVGDLTALIKNKKRPEETPIERYVSNIFYATSLGLIDDLGSLTGEYGPAGQVSAVTGPTGGDIYKLAIQAPQSFDPKKSFTREAVKSIPGIGQTLSNTLIPNSFVAPFAGPQASEASDIKAQKKFEQKEGFLDRILSSFNKGEVSSVDEIRSRIGDGDTSVTSEEAGRYYLRDIDTKETEKTKIGDIEVSHREKDNFNFPDFTKSAPGQSLRADLELGGVGSANIVFHMKTPDGKVINVPQTTENLSGGEQFYGLQLDVPSNSPTGTAQVWATVNGQEVADTRRNHQIVNSEPVNRYRSFDQTGKEIGSVNRVGPTFDRATIDSQFNRFETEKRTTKLYSRLSDINTNEKLTPEQKTGAEDVLLKELGATREDYDYYKVAKENVDARTAFVLDELESGNIKDRKELIQYLASGRKEVNGKMQVTKGVLDKLKDLGILIASEVKKILAFKFTKDKSGKLIPEVKVTGRGKGAKLKKISLSSAPSIKTRKIKAPSFKVNVANLIGPSVTSSNISKINAKNFAIDPKKFANRVKTKISNISTEPKFNI